MDILNHCEPQRRQDNNNMFFNPTPENFIENDVMFQPLHIDVEDTYVEPVFAPLAPDFGLQFINTPLMNDSSQDRFIQETVEGFPLLSVYDSCPPSMFPTEVSSLSDEYAAHLSPTFPSNFYLKPLSAAQQNIYFVPPLDPSMAQLRSLHNIKSHANANQLDSSLKNAKRTKSMPLIGTENQLYDVYINDIEEVFPETESLADPYSQNPYSQSNIDEIFQRELSTIASNIEFDSPGDYDEHETEFKMLNFRLNQIPEKLQPKTFPLRLVANNAVANNLPSETGVPKKSIAYLCSLRITSTRFGEILRLAKERNLKYESVKNVLEVFCNSYASNPLSHVVNRHNIALKLKIVCGLVDLCKKHDVPASDHQVILSKFPLIETQDSVLVQVKTSCGEDVKCDGVNDTIGEELVRENFDLTKLEGLLQFDIFRNLIGEASNSTENYIKRPLNSFMIYRSSMIKAASVLIIFRQLNKLITYYYGILNELPGVQVIREELVLRLIEFDLNEMNKKISYDLARGNLLAHITQSVCFRLQSELEVIKNNFNAHSQLRFKKLNGFNIVENYRRIKMDHGTMCHVIALLWLTEDTPVKEDFNQFSKLEKQTHERLYPNYKYAPKKKKKLSEELRVKKDEKKPQKPRKDPAAVRGKKRTRA